MVASIVGVEWRLACALVVLLVPTGCSDDATDNGSSSGSAGTGASATSTGGAGTSTSSSDGGGTASGGVGGSSSSSSSGSSAGGSGDQEILFDMYQSGSYPAYAWTGSPADSEGARVYFSVSQLAGEAPSGRDAVRITGIGVQPGPQNITCEWGLEPADLGPTPQGTVRYARWSMRLSGPQNWQRADNGGRAGHKAFILGNHCECYSPECLDAADTLAPTRVIVLEEGFTPTAPFSDVHMFGNQNIGCGGGGINQGLDCSTESAPNQGIVYPASDTWYRIQVKVQSSSTESTPDGYIAIWVREVGDTSSYSEDAPDAISNDTFILKTTGWWDNPDCGSTSIVWGPATMRPFHTDAAYAEDWADFQLAATFDPSWAQP